MNAKKIPGSILLLIAAMIWGSAFVAQSLGADNVSPFTFNASRSVIGALVIVPVFLFMDKKKPEGRVKNNKLLLLGGIGCGILLFIACNLQQFGISYMDTAGKTAEEIESLEKANVGKVGFLTALYIVLVPVFGIFIGKKAGKLIWVSVLVALAGMYLLCIKPGFVIGTSDIYAILCAVAFALQILLVDAVAPKVDPIRLSCLQFAVCGAISWICALIIEKPDAASILRAWAPILYTGAMSSGIAYTLQIVGQVRCRSEVASLVMSLESVFSALFGYVILHQALSTREFIGCAVIFAAVILAQLPDRRRNA
ncbi:MAG: DMT family transporter [Clostridia bacterium]|nr:DMT family transporter [Clostridia bacterium]